MAHIDYHNADNAVKNDDWFQKADASFRGTYKKLCEIERGNAERLARQKVYESADAENFALLLFALVLVLAFLMSL